MRSLRAEFFQADGQTDGWTQKQPDIMQLIFAFYNFVKTSSKYLTWIKLLNPYFPH